MIKDSCEGSGLSTIESSQDSHPLFFIYFFNKAMLSQVIIHMIAGVHTNGAIKAFLGAPKHLYNWLCPSVGWSVCWLVGRVTHSFDDPHGIPFWPPWPRLSLMNLPGRYFTMILSIL